jgi:hypothetical protein
MIARDWDGTRLPPPPTPVPGLDLQPCSHHLHRAPYSILSYIGNHITIRIIALCLCHPIMEGGPDAVMSTKGDDVLVLEGGWAICASCLSSVQFVLACHYTHREPSPPHSPSHSSPFLGGIQASITSGFPSFLRLCLLCLGFPSPSQCGTQLLLRLLHLADGSLRLCCALCLLPCSAVGCGL